MLFNEYQCSESIKIILKAAAQTFNIYHCTNCIKIIKNDMKHQNKYKHMSLEWYKSIQSK